MAIFAPNQSSFSGLRVAITGASSGIGRAIAEQAAARGARVVIGARRLDKLQELAAGNPNLLPLVVDVADEAASRAWVREAGRLLGGLDVVIANAGYGDLCPVAEYSGEQFRRIFEVNVTGSWAVCAEAISLMKAQPVSGKPPMNKFRGHIMMVSSAAARRGLPLFGPYSATKAAQLSLCEALRVEHWDDRIAVTSIHPVGTDTEFFNIAESTGKGKMPPRSKGEIRQTAEQVARRVCDAFGRNVREVWPFRPARFLLALVSIWPWLGDRVMYKVRGMMSKAK